MTNNHVGMSICPLCGECKHIVLATTYQRDAKGKFESVVNIPNEFVDSPDLCEKCEKKLKEEDTFVIFEADHKTVIKNNKTNKPILTGKYIILSFNLMDRSCPFYDFVKENRFILAIPEEFKNISNMLKEKQKCQNKN